MHHLWCGKKRSSCSPSLTTDLGAWIHIPIFLGCSTNYQHVPTGQMQPKWRFQICRCGFPHLAPCLLIVSQERLLALLAFKWHRCLVSWSNSSKFHQREGAKHMESKSAEAALGSNFASVVFPRERARIKLQVSTGNRHNIIQYLRHIHK